MYSTVIKATFIITDIFHKTTQSCMTYRLQISVADLFY